MFFSQSFRSLNSILSLCVGCESLIRVSHMSKFTTRLLTSSSPPVVCITARPSSSGYSFFRHSVRTYGTSKSEPIEAEIVKEDDELRAGVPNDDGSDRTSKSRKPDLMETVRKNVRGKLYNLVDLATGLDYMNSSVYHNIYRGKPVWFYYRRNFKGHFPPPRTRKNCVIGKKLITSNPCPICRDEYLVLDFRNTALLTQFINPISSDILEPSTTGLCRHQHNKLVLEIEKARDIGTIELWLPFHLYNYRDYYGDLDPEQLEALLKASGYVPLTQEDDAHVSAPSTTTLNELPPAVQDILLESTATIPHAREFVPKLAETDWSRPRVPNRYKMEEERKARIARQRRSRTLLLNV